MSNQGDQGDQGDQGFVGGAGGGGGGLIFADRVDLPFVTAEYAPGKPIAGQRINLATFPDRNWTAQWYSWRALTEFVSDAERWNNYDILPLWAPTGEWNSKSAYPVVQCELDTLVVDARDERADALAEILSQKDEFISYFLGLLDAVDGYPATSKILGIASMVGGFCAMYYKAKYRRPRPSMLLPALLPPTPVPGHASFPSGHSTQAHLMRLCMIDVLTGPPPSPLLPRLETMKNDMQALADRIARNREIAGLHYPSDSAAGVSLASQIHKRLAESSASFRVALEAAQQEWLST
jgi:hypothetical protein